MEGSMHLVSPYPVSLYFPLLSWLAYDHLIWTDLLVFLSPQNIHKQTEGNICWVRFSINSKHPPDPPFSFIMYTNLSMMTIHLIKYSEWLQLDLKCCFLLSLSCVYVTYFLSCIPLIRWTYYPHESFLNHDFTSAFFSLDGFEEARKNSLFAFCYVNLNF